MAESVFEIVLTRYLIDRTVDLVTIQPCISAATPRSQLSMQLIRIYHVHTTTNIHEASPVL